MRVSVIDASTLKEIEAHRNALRALLTKFSFALADNVRWLPHTARELFEGELERANNEGLTLIKDLLQGDVDAFLTKKRTKLEADLNGLYSQLGKSGKVTDEVIEQVTINLKDRLTKAQCSSLSPQLSYSSVSFSPTECAFASPWGQAFSLLSDIAVCQRKAYTDSFFFRVLKNTSKQDFLRSMNVADDTLARSPVNWETEDRCKKELGLISEIEIASIEPRERCLLVQQIILGCPFASVAKDFEACVLRQKICGLFASVLK